MSGGLEEPRRREALRLLKLAGDRLEEAYRDMRRFEPRRAEGRVVKAASLICAAGVTILGVHNSEAHWTVAGSLRVSAKTIESVSDPGVRAAWQDMMTAESICQGDIQPQ